MKDDRPPARRRTGQWNPGEPPTSELIEIGGLPGFEGQGPTHVRAYVIDAAELEALKRHLNESQQAERPSPWKRGHHKVPRVGWSLVIAAVSDTTVGVAAIVSGSTVIGLVSSVAVGVCSVVLVVSEAWSQMGRGKDGLDRRPTSRPR